MLQRKGDRLPHKFPLGVVVITTAAHEVLSGPQVTHLLLRHVAGDWGDLLDEHDRRENERALEEGNRLLSAYQVGNRKVWVITEADRSSTTVLFPEDY